ncbi:MAG: YjfB family protein [Lachnospiraceae bacterium]
MDVTALTSQLIPAQVMQQAGIQVLDNTLETVKTLNEGMVKMMENSVNPSIGSNIDISI